MSASTATSQMDLEESKVRIALTTGWSGVTKVLTGGKPAIENTHRLPQKVCGWELHNSLTKIRRAHTVRMSFLTDRASQVPTL